jgi:hypothetical protein
MLAGDFESQHTLDHKFGDAQAAISEHQAATSKHQTANSKHQAATSEQKPSD